MENEEGDAMDKLLQKKIEKLERTSTFVEHLKELGWTAPTLPAAPVPEKQSVLIFCDTAGFCQGIIDRAPKGRLGKTHFVDDAPMMMSKEEVEELLKVGWDLVIFGSGLDLPLNNDPHQIVQHQTRITRLYFYIAKAIAQSNMDGELHVQKLSVLTRGVFTEDAGLANHVGVRLATSGTLFGFTNSARYELPIPIQFVDVDCNPMAPSWQHTENYSPTAPSWNQDEAPLLDRLASEVFRVASFGHNTVRLRHDGRYVLRQIKATKYEEANHQFLLPSEGVIAVTGGNGGIALVLGNMLLDKTEHQHVGGFSIVFLSRSAKVPEYLIPQWEAIQMKAARLGVKVAQMKCDVSNAQACDQFIASQTPNLVGIIHAAGLANPTLLIHEKWAGFETLAGPKSWGAIYLNDALDRHNNPNLKFFWMFSSSSVNGDAGTVSYGCANSYLDALCRYRRSIGRPGTAIQWGPWGEVGMAATLMDDKMKARQAASLYPPFTNNEAVRGLQEGLKTGLPGVMCYLYNPQAMLKANKDCSSATACYIRNFTNELMPTLGAPSLERIHLYTLIRMLDEGYYGEPGQADTCEQEASSKWLRYQQYIQPAIEDGLDSAWW